MMAGLWICRVHLLSLLIGLILRTIIAQDPCVSSNEFAIYVQEDDLDGAAEGIYRAEADFIAANDFSKVSVSTDENPTAISYDVVEDLLYWAGNDVTIGKYIKKSPIAGGTTQEKSLITTCTGTALGVENGDISDAHIVSSTSATNAGPTRARLNLANGLDTSGTVAAGTLGAWIPTYQADIDANPHWISVNFLGRPTITGVKLQGRADAAMWTKTYWVEHSQNFATWIRVKDSSGADATFIGNTDQTTVVQQTFHEPVVALYLRILPRTWEDSVDAVNKVPALRFGVLGCKVGQCTAGGNLGVEDGSILDSQLSAKSGTASNGRLNSATGWIATGTTTGVPDGEYIQVLFGSRVTVTAIVLQGARSPITGSPITDAARDIYIQYWDDTASTAGWRTIKDQSNADKNFDTTISADTDTIGSITLSSTEMVSTTGLRLFPADISRVECTSVSAFLVACFTFPGTQIALRFEVQGCKDPVVSNMAVYGTCGSKKIYWVESGHEVGKKIHYTNLESSSPTEQTLLDSQTGTIVDIELYETSHLLYFARQSSATSSYIHSANLNGIIQQSHELSSTNGNIQSIAIDTETQRVYYSINPGNSEDGRIGYANLALTSHTTIYEVSGSGMTFQPFAIAVFGDYVYVMRNKDAIERVEKTLTGSATASTNTPTAVVTSLSTGGSLSTDLQFIKCVSSEATVKFENPTYSKFESENVVDVRILRSGDLSLCSSVEMTIIENGAQDTVDFSLAANPSVSGTPPVVKFDGGMDSIQLRFLITSDNDIVATLGEGDESFTVMLNSNSMETELATPSSTVITIKDYDSCYYFDDPGTVSYTEEDVDAIKTIGIKREGYLKQAGQIYFDYEDGTAKRFTDYDITTNIVMFSSVTGSVSAQTQSVSITVKGDSVIEDPTDESFKLKLLVPANIDYTFLCPNKLHEKTVTITDNDFSVYLQKTNIEVLESSPTVSIPVCREGQTVAAAVVPYSVHDDSAKQGQDYNDANNPKQVTITAGNQCTNIIINIVDDFAREYFEAFYLSITLGTGNKQTYVQIKDDDIAIRIEHDRYEITEANDLNVTLLREGNLTNDQDVSLVAVEGDAVAISDFVGFEPIEFKAGEQEKTAFIDIIDDNDDEQSEDFTLRLINGAGQILSSATVTILDNDDPPLPGRPQIYSFDRRSISVNENTERISVAVTRTLIERAGSVTVSTSSGTATSGSDFISLTQTVVKFARDDSRQLVFIEILNDQVDESDETFTLQLSNPSDGTLSGYTTVVVTIIDDDQGGEEGDGDDGIALSMSAILVIIAGAGVIVLTVLGLIAWGACLLARARPRPQPVASLPARYPQILRGPYNNRAIRPV